MMHRAKRSSHEADTRQVTLICTLKNEEGTIRDLLQSMCSQTSQPEEVILVDGGSTDKTTEIINEPKYSRLPIRLIVQPGANIAKGRNVAIGNSRTEIIASTDGGCVLCRDWLRAIVEPFRESSVDVVSGTYAPLTETQFEEVAACLTFPSIEALRSDAFMPSSRSVAFRKSAWASVGGYPEDLDTAEDTLFDIRLRDAGFRFALAKNAVVYWRARENLRQIFRQFYGYSKGDGLALLFPRRYSYRYAAAFALILAATKLWESLAFWLTVGVLIVIILWVRSIRKITRPTPRKMLIALSIVLAMELSRLLGYGTGIYCRLRNSIMV